jgi:hypothetical protein
MIGLLKELEYLAGIKGVCIFSTEDVIFNT